MRASRRLLQCVQHAQSLHRATASNKLSPCLSHTNHFRSTADRHLYRSFCTSTSSTTEEAEADQNTASDTTSTTTDEVPGLKATFDEKVDKEHLASHTFQAETRQLLDIVSKSLYTDKEVFLRELLSNASDAMEKVRYQVNKDSSTIINTETPLEINVFTDKEKGQIIIQDAGIGMNESELVDNIGTIARSGSKAFVRSLADKPAGTGKASHIIGQFGVGFYSVFMVSDNVEVYSLSAVKDNAESGYYWVSDGTGSYSIATAENVARGTKIVINLKEDAIEEFADKHRVEGIIKKYSSYLEYPIKLNGSLITSSGAIWARTPKEVKEFEYKEFYQLISNRYDDPLYTIHTHFDSAKYSAQVLAYFPPTHEEKFGAGRMKPGLNIYCRKVLVKREASEIVPDWLRFVKGAVDSENIPIHISRENMQDSTLIKQLQESIMMKIVDFLKKQSKKDPEKYLKWYNEFGGFVKEGVCTDYQNRSRIANLLRFETSKLDEKGKKSLEEYVKEMQAEQTEIYYLIAPNRTAALDSPYMEAFLDSDIEVLFCYAQIDEFCMKNLGQFKSKNIVGIESSTAVLKENKAADALSEDDCRRLGRWLKQQFPKHVQKAEPTYRLKKHPAVLVDHQSAAIRQYLNALGEDVSTPPQRMQINPSHNIIKGLFEKVQTDEATAMVIARQMINNAFVAAGILDDPRDMLKDMNMVMEIALGYAPQLEAKDMAAANDEGPNPKAKGMDFEQEIVDKMNREIEEAGIDRNDPSTLKAADADVDDAEVISHNRDAQKGDFKSNE